MYGNTRWALVVAAGLLTTSCTVFFPKDLKTPAAPVSKATITPATLSSSDLEALPKPMGQVVAAVYGFRDMTGQYKPQPDSAYSTMVSQGGTAILMKALLESSWFLPVEREGLQNLMTERRIVRAINEGNVNAGPPQLPNLLPASIIIEGGVIAYESNVKTGGAGLRYYGFGVNDQYRTDQITVSLRAIDVRTGRVIASVATTKTVYSQKLQGDFFRYVRFKRLLEAEAGVTRNEPTQLCLQDAVEAAVVRMVALGIRSNLWTLADQNDLNNPLLKDTWVELGLDEAPGTGSPVADMSALPAGKTRPTAKPQAKAAPKPALTLPNGNTPPPPEPPAPSVKDAAAAQMPGNAMPQPSAPPSGDGVRW